MAGSSSRRPRDGARRAIRGNSSPRRGTAAGGRPGQGRAIRLPVNRWSLDPGRETPRGSRQKLGLEGIRGARSESHHRAARVVTRRARSRTAVGAAGTRALVTPGVIRVIAVVVVAFLAGRIGCMRGSGVEPDVRGAIDRQPAEGQHQGNASERDSLPQPAEGAQRGGRGRHDAEPLCVCSCRQAPPAGRWRMSVGHPGEVRGRSQAALPGPWARSGMGAPGGGLGPCPAGGTEDGRAAGADVRGRSRPGPDALFGGSGCGEVASP